MKIRSFQFSKDPLVSISNHNPVTIKPDSSGTYEIRLIPESLGMTELLCTIYTNFGIINYKVLSPLHRLSQSDRRSGHREPLQGPPLHEHPHPPREHVQPIHFALESQQNAQNPRIPRGSLRSAAPNPHCRAQRDGSGFSISLIAEWVVPEQSSAVIFAFSVASSSWSGSAYFFVRFLMNR